MEFHDKEGPETQYLYIHRRHRNDADSTGESAQPGGRKEKCLSHGYIRLNYIYAEATDVDRGEIDDFVETSKVVCGETARNRSGDGGIEKTWLLPKEISYLAAESYNPAYRVELKPVGQTPHSDLDVCDVW